MKGRAMQADACGVPVGITAIY